MKRRRKFISISIAAVMSIALVAGLALSSRSSLPDKSREAVQADVDSDDQRALPAFEANLANGDRITDAQVKAPAVIHLFASWCEVCQGEAPAFAQLQRKHPDLNYYLVAVEDSPVSAGAFMRSFGWKTAPLIDDPRRELEAEFALVGQPHTIFVNEDRDMTIHQGGASFGDLDALAQRIA